MWELLPRYWQVVIVVGLGIIGWEATKALSALFGGTAPGFFRYMSLAATILLTPLVYVADRYWPQIVAQAPWLQDVTFPDLNGRWKGSLQSSWIDPKTNEQIEPRDVTIDIRLSLLSISVSMRTSESRSESTWCRPEANRSAGVFRLRYLYENAPQARVADRSNMHEGMCCLEFRLAEDKGAITGKYYTYRGTRGDIELRREVAKT